MKEHPGPRIDNIPVSGAIGLVFVVGVMAMILVGVPEARLWIYIAVPIGIVVGLLLRYKHRGQM